MSKNVIADLAAVALDQHGRARFDRERADSGYANDVEFLVQVGQEHKTIGWVDWAGEDDEHQVRDLVLEACGRLGLPVPVIAEDTEDRVTESLGQQAQRGDYPPALLAAVDSQLADAGLRLLLIELDDDCYHYVPVTVESFATLNGVKGEAHSLYGADEIPV